MYLTTRPAAFADPITPVVAYFRPEYATDRSKQNRAQVFLLSHVFGPILGLSVPAALYFLDPTPHADLLVLASGIALFWLFPFLMKGQWSYRILVRLSVVNLNFCIYWSCYFYGGISSPTLIWVLIIPILSVFYLGDDPRQRRELVLVSAVSALVFTLAFFLTDPPGNDISPKAMSILSASSLVAVAFYIAIMAIYYARVFDAGQDLEREVARRRLMSVELRRSVDAATKASMAKSDFLARMSHELRSPLNAILGYAELILEDMDDADDSMSRRDLGRILEAGGYLARLIDSILNIAKIESGKMELMIESCDLREVVDKVVAGQRTQADKNGNTVEVSVPEDTRFIQSDLACLAQVLEIVVQNAVQYTTNGRVSISAMAADDRDPDHVKLVVSDCGIGISPDLLPSIFELFHTEREAANSRYGGTGLSLSLANKLCQILGGAITVESREGQGSTFQIALPANPPRK